MEEHDKDNEINPGCAREFLTGTFFILHNQKDI